MARVGASAGERKGNALDEKGRMVRTGNIVTITTAIITTKQENAGQLAGGRMLP
jgi:hypothetical protein